VEFGAVADVQLSDRTQSEWHGTPPLQPPA
jgi:hypothetical protein